MANDEHLAHLKQGVEGWNAWRQENSTISIIDLHGADLREANLFRANLHGADLFRADLRAASLREANLSGANLHGADLTGTDLTGANLTETSLIAANLSETHLTEANLTEANLFRANLSGANLTEANLTRAIFYETTLSNTELPKARGLDSCRHNGPSTIDHRTIMRSGRLPLAFLQGCGLPDTLIDPLFSLLNEPLQFFSCFISYSSKDDEFARRLHADLQEKSVRCWFSPHDSQGGKKALEQIVQAIHGHDKLLLVLSDNSMTSEWVQTEIATARQREIAETRRVLFPIRLVDFESIKNWQCFDADTGKDSAREIREFFIPDFSTWKDHDTYKKAFARLLHDLKAEATEEQGKKSPREG